MNVVGSVPWSIRSDTPKELLFLGYIGRQEGFQVPETAPPASSIETEWQAWWQFLLTHNFGTLGEAVRRDTPGITGIPFLRELGRRHQAVYDPPEFSVLADHPALQTLCQRCVNAGGPITIGSGKPLAAASWRFSSRCPNVSSICTPINSSGNACAARASALCHSRSASIFSTGRRTMSIVSRLPTSFWAGAISLTTPRFAI